MLIFFLACLTVVGVLVQSLLSVQVASLEVTGSKDLEVIADALALSGFDILCGIEAHGGPDNGPEFLAERERNFPPGQPYDFPQLFGLPVGAAALDFSPPVDYPPLTDLALTYAPLNDPPNVFGNDIRLPLFVAGKFPALTTNSIAGSQPAAILPRPSFQPPTSDSDYAGLGVNANPSIFSISALQPSPAAGGAPFGWWGPRNSGSFLPPLASFQGPAGNQKMPPPSLMIVRDLLTSWGQTYRCYIYMWYVRSQFFNSPQQYYYLASGRMRRVSGLGALEFVGKEEVVSATQFR